MTSRSRLNWTTVFMAFAFCFPRSWANELGRKKKKNVLILMSDEHSFRVSGAYDNLLVKTPTLDAISKSGVSFRAAYCQNPICVPSRASFGTGMRPSKVGVFHNEAQDFDTLRDHPLTMPRIFTKAGYVAEWFGKEHWATNNTGFGFGDKNNDWKETLKRTKYYRFGKVVGHHPKDAQTFGDEVKPEADALIADMAIDWLDEYNGSEPFLLGVSFRTPHYPFVVEKKYYDMYKDDIDVPRVTQAMIDDLPKPNRVRRDRLGYGKMTDEEIKRARAVYYGMVTFVDEQYASVLKKLEEKGLRDDTVIVYLSDHGESLGEHGLWYKNSFYEDSVKVPLIMSYPPEIPRNSRVKSPVMLMDVLPTLLELCEIDIPPGLDGKSLMPLIYGKENGWKRHAISETFASRAGRMVRMRNWKYCWYANGGNQFFNVWRDPMEENNLYNNTKYQKLIKRLHKLAMVDFLDRPKLTKKKENRRG